MIITLTNPFSAATVTRDITDLTAQQLDAYAEIMDDDIRESVHDDLAPCKPAEFLAEYVKRVGPDAAGILILGG